MKISVCGIACGKCPRLLKGTCPYGNSGCVPNMDDICRISVCAFNNNVSCCFDCEKFPCDLTREGPLKFEYCKYIAGD